MTVLTRVSAASIKRAKRNPGLPRRRVRGERLMLPFQKPQSNRNISYGVTWFFQVRSRLRTAMRSKAKIDWPINDVRAPSGRSCHRARLPGRRYALPRAWLSWPFKQRCEVFCARKLLVFMHHARIDFGEIDLRRPISPKSALRNASQRCHSGRMTQSEQLVHI